MKPKLLINVWPVETRVAYIGESGDLIDFKIEKKTSPTLVGSVHAAKVLRVLPGMQSAFVDIGLEKAAFLYVGDIITPKKSSKVLVEGMEEELEEPLIDNNKKSPEDKLQASLRENDEELPRIQDLITNGQRIMVQVSKDAIGTKGARVTTHISLPGRRVVFMPTVQHVGISRKIVDESEKERLKTIMEDIEFKDGIIVRTAGEGATKEQFIEDIEYLKRLWSQVKTAYDEGKSIGLLHREINVELRAVRDMITEDIEQIIVDNLEKCEEIKEFIGQFMPSFDKSIVKMHQGGEPLFERFGVDLEVSRALSRKVWLKSGGYVVIDEAEALTVIDVNTGAYVGKKDLEETIFKTNMEAVFEIAYQIRLRNSGGIIIVDFIDMQKEAHKEKVLNTLREIIVNDPGKPLVISMSSLGLVEITRKRMRSSLQKTLGESCPYCDAKGFIMQQQTVAMEIFRDVEKESLRGAIGKQIVVHCNKEVANWVYDEGQETIEEVESKLDIRLEFKATPGYHREKYNVIVSSKVEKI